jgi:proteasome lid subunit RPN8/RPN11
MKIVYLKPFDFEDKKEEEQIGLLFGYRYGSYLSIYSCVPVDNEHPDPRRHFEVTKKQIKEAEATTWDYLQGVVHTHPDNDPNPSEEDMNGLPKGMIGAIWTPRHITWYGSKGVVLPTYL